MKKCKRIGALLLATSLFIVGCGSKDTAKETASSDEIEIVQPKVEAEIEFPYDYTSAEFFEIENCWDYAPQATTSGLFEDGTDYKLKSVDKFMTMQGGCTDGTYAYFLLEQKGVTDDETGDLRSLCMLFKVDMQTWTVVDQSAPLKVDHGNCLSYNPKTNELIATHCQYLTKVISYIDPNTLTVKSQYSVGRNIHSCVYNAKRDQYVVGIKGTPNFVVFDSEWNQIGEYQGVTPSYDVTYQNLTCDDDYVYILYCGGTNAIMCYTWEGSFVGCYKVDYTAEIEAIFYVGDQYYVTFYTGNGGTVRKIQFDKSYLY